MVLAGLFAGILFLGLVLADWFQFTRLLSGTGLYGFVIARGEDELPLIPWTKMVNRFDRGGVLKLPHGMARFFHDERRILLRPLAHRFRTAWPINGAIEIVPEDNGARLTWTKRVPWSSAVLTLVWFVVVVIGTLAFAVSFALQGGLSSLSGLVIAVGIACTGILVLAFGLITVSLAYRLENQRLTQAYQELRAALLEG